MLHLFSSRGHAHEQDLGPLLYLTLDIILGPEATSILKERAVLAPWTRLRRTLPYSTLALYDYALAHHPHLRMMMKVAIRQMTPTISGTSFSGYGIDLYPHSLGLTLGTLDLIEFGVVDLLQIATSTGEDVPHDHDMPEESSQFPILPPRRKKASVSVH
jgi:hypothetical protein